MTAPDLIAVTYEQLAQQAPFRPPGYVEDVFESAAVREEFRLWLSASEWERLAGKYRQTHTPPPLPQGCCG